VVPAAWGGGVQTSIENPQGRSPYRLVTKKKRLFTLLARETGIATKLLGWKAVLKPAAYSTPNTIESNLYRIP
jgi:hypothetical protein